MALSTQVRPLIIEHHQYNNNCGGGMSQLQEINGGSLLHHQQHQQQQQNHEMQQQQQHQHHDQQSEHLQQHHHQQTSWLPAPMKFESSSDSFLWQGRFTTEFLANNDAYFSQSEAAAAVAAATAANAVSTTASPSPPPPQNPTTTITTLAAATEQVSMATTNGGDSNAITTSTSPPLSLSLMSSMSEVSDLDSECLGTHSQPGPYNLQLRLEEQESQPAPSFHQRLNASGGSSLWYAVGFHATEAEIMRRALTTPEEKITKSIVLRNREVLASLWCKELVPVRLHLHGNFTAVAAESRAARLVIRCGAFKQPQLPVKECSVCSDQKHRGGWYGADKRDTNSSKNIPESLQHYWPPAESNRETLHKNSLVIVRNDSCSYHTDSRGRVYATMPIVQQQQASSTATPIELLLYYTCMTTHGHDGTAPNSKDTFTSVQLETLDCASGRWMVRGRCVFRMRMVTSPERDILNEVTQFLNPAQMGCRLGCSHLESHNTRWQRAKILRTQGQEKLEHYMQLYGAEPGVKKIKIAGRQATGSNADPTDDQLDLMLDPSATVVTNGTVPSAPQDSLSLEVSEQDDALIVRGQLLGNAESRELVANALRAYLASLPLMVRSVAAAAQQMRNVPNKQEPLLLEQTQQQQQQQIQQFQQQLTHQQPLGICLSSPPSCQQTATTTTSSMMQQENSPADSLHSVHCSSATSSMSEHVVYHMPELGMPTGAEASTADYLAQLGQQQHQQYYSQLVTTSNGQAAYLTSGAGGIGGQPAAPVYFINSAPVTSSLPPLQHIAPVTTASSHHNLQHHHQHQQQQQQQQLFQQQQQQQTTNGNFGHDQVDGVVEQTETEKQPHRISSTNSTSLLRRLMMAKRRRLRGGTGGALSMGQLFKAKQRAAFH